MKELAIALVAAGLLFGCVSEGDDPSADVQVETPQAETSMPAPTDSTEAPAVPAPLEVNTFSLQELADKGTLGCSVLLKRSEEDDDYVYFEGPELALMKVEQGWVEFLYDDGSRFGDDVRSLTSQDDSFTATVEITRGDKLGYEVTNIPAATIELQLGDEPPTVISAVGEVGC